MNTDRIALCSVRTADERSSVFIGVHLWFNERCMSEPFCEVASIDYPIVDADAHVYEPADVWQARVAQRLRAQAPMVTRTDEGDVWSFDGGARVRPVGLMAAA